MDILMGDPVRHQILAAIGTTSDQNLKTVLLLMLAILEEISGKIEEMRSDEKGLREAVLNGHEGVHHDHHEWVARKIAEEADEARANKESRRNIRDEVAKWILLGLLTAGAGMAGWHMK
jgi:exopolyphosphatase/pppGpp-phosphohydrolase